MWYKDKTLIKLSRQHDDAINNKDINKLENLIDESLNLAKNTELHSMIRAKHYYNCATSISERGDLINSNVSNREKTIEKELFLFRESITLQEEYYNKEIKLESSDEANWKSLYYSSIVNYSNILSNVGRISSAIQEIKKVAKSGFSMAVGNLGGYLKHYFQVDYNIIHKKIFLYEMLLLTKFAIQTKDSSLHPIAEESFKKDLENGLKLYGDITETSLSLNDILLFNRNEIIDWFDTEIDEEERYQNWKITNSLVLNTLNDYDTSDYSKNDTLHLPSMVRPIDERQPIFSGLFNQIKQEYCSARYFIFDGIYNRNLHFSDKEVFLINLYDYPVYGINIEKIKAGYRSIYSLFDRIAYFLNEYFQLGIQRNKITFKSIWKGIYKSDKKGNDINKFFNNNYLLKSLYWIKKDLYNETKSEYNGRINPKLYKANKIRNTMEHKYLKIVDDTFIDLKSVEDNLAEITIERSEFEELSIELLKILRETIIILTQIIYLEENKLNQYNLPLVGTNKYDDNWKI